MRRLALLLTVLTLAAPAGAVGSAPSLRAPSLDPLRVQGLRFSPGERVTVRLAGGGALVARVVRATRTGTFSLTFPALSIGPCTPYLVTARGTAGHRAALRSRPIVACSPGAGRTGSASPSNTS